uniref:Serine and arginine rich splicing factor 5 n=2 Tax=Eptatretus burgeri TaxID=7764 RepID=A0A8C4Q413_EPTBU
MYSDLLEPHTMTSCRVFIGRLGPDVRTRDVERFFKGYGRIRDIDIKTGFGFVEFDDSRDAEDAICDLNGKELNNERITVEHARPPRTRNVQMEHYSSRMPPFRRGGPRSVFLATQSLIGFVWSRVRDGERNLFDSWKKHSCFVLCRFGPPSRTDHRLLVENLSSSVSWQDLKDYMRQAGEVIFADAHRSRQNEGVVEFASRSDMMNALDKLDGKEINGRKIHLREEKKQRSRSHSRSRSRTPRSGTSPARGARRRSSSGSSVSRSPGQRRQDSPGHSSPAPDATEQKTFRSRSRSESSNE